LLLLLCVLSGLALSGLLGLSDCQLYAAATRSRRSHLLLLLSGLLQSVLGRALVALGGSGASLVGRCILGSLGDRLSGLALQCVLFGHDDVLCVELFQVTNRAGCFVLVEMWDESLCARVMLAGSDAATDSPFPNEVTIQPPPC